MLISILCVADKSNYCSIPDLDLYNLKRDAYTFNGNNKVIAHPPCQQWSKLKSFAKENIKERDLAMFCLEKVMSNGGIFEHPLGSSFFTYAGINSSRLIKVYQSSWGFAAPKPTLLFFKDVKPLAEPLCFTPAPKRVKDLHSSQRSIMPLSFCNWLVDAVRYS